MLPSCENDLDSVRTVTATDDSPTEVVNQLHTIYSDSGIVKLEMTAARVEKYPQRQLTLFKNGLDVTFFKEKDQPTACLEAEYAEMKQQGTQLVITARNNVVLTNYAEGRTLRTEELIWSQADQDIRTDKRFELFGEDYYASGVGLQADETLSDYEMHQVSIEKKINTANGLR